MSPFAIAALSFSMSSDACAAAIARGTAHRHDLAAALRSGAVFGAIETVTPLLGWALGTVAAEFVTGVDHWIAFVLLVLVGGKMIIDGWGKRGVGAVEPHDVEPRGRLALVLTAIGTSIDAAAVGVTLAFIDVNIIVVAVAIGTTTFLLTTLGLLVGRALGNVFGSWVEIAGGVVLVSIGAVILLQHTGHL